MGEGRFVDCGGGVRVERRVPCCMSDGVVLYSDHYTPTETGTRPTLLLRQMDGRVLAATQVFAHPAWFARHGFNVVVQDVRGRGASEGEFYPFRFEGRDGADTIAFVRGRRESNGRVGMYGHGYAGMTQLAAAGQDPRGLECIAPAMTAFDLYHGWFYHNGALRLEAALGWGMALLMEDARRSKLDDALAALEAVQAKLFSPAPEIRRSVEAALEMEGVPTYVSDWLTHRAAGDFWSSMDVSRAIGKIRVPALHTAGWYDGSLKGSVDGYLALRSRAGSAHGRDHQYLVAGPWTSARWGDHAGSHFVGSEANLDTNALLLRWFNHWLKDSSEFNDEPRVRHFALNEGRWHTAKDWPMEAGHTFYLHSKGRANSRRGDGLLSGTAPRTPEAADIFVDDAEAPVPAPEPGPSDQSLLELENQLLVYTTSPLEAPVHVFGAPEVELYFSSTSPACDLVVKLVCVRPSAAAQCVCIGIARSTFLFEDAEYRPDVPKLWHFLMEPTSWVFEAGDCIRIEVASSAFPRYDCCLPATVGVQADEAETRQQAMQMVFHDPEHLSAIHLPVAGKQRESRR